MSYDRGKSSKRNDTMKKSLSYIITFCLGVALASSGTFAAAGDVIEATFSKFTFIVDGETKQLEADPLVYQGSTYLPVRVVANLLGKDVVYKADSKTIELNTPAYIEQTSKSKGNDVVNDFRQYSPEIIKGQIISLNAMIEREVNPEVKADLKEKVAERTAHLESLGDYESIIKLTRDIAAKKSLIDSQKDSLKQFDQELRYEEYEIHLEQISRYETELADLEAQKAALETQQ